MKLIRYRVTNFRSVMDSGWIDCDDVTTLIGVNEAGKSNLLLGLWKLNPAQGGTINPLQDMPRRHYSEWRDAADKPVFIEAVFDLSPAVVTQVVKLSNAIPANVARVEVSRDFSGKRFIHFPDATTASGIPVELTREIISATVAKLSAETGVALE